MKLFPIMAMKPGDAVTVTTEWDRHGGTVNWWDRHGGFRVSVRLADGTDEVFEASGPRQAQFWR